MNGELSFYVTFGNKWRRFQHPHSLHGIHPHPDGWVRIIVSDEGDPTDSGGLCYDKAFGIAKATFNNEFAGLYSEEGHDASYYPLRELGTINKAGETL